MTDYRAADDHIEKVEPRSRFGAISLLLLLAVVVIVVLFATGFFSATVTKQGEMPNVSVKADAGALPVVDVDSKQIVVGTKPTAVDVPTVETKKVTVDVPVVGVKD